jgi:hypothetical protein
MFLIKCHEDIKLLDTEYYKLLVEHVVARIRQNKMALLIFVGGTGKGKSLAMLFILEKIHQMLHPDKPFTCERNVCFTTTRFLELVRSSPDKTCIAFDESSIAMNSKRSMSNLNLVLGNLFTAFRARRFIVGLAFPTFSALEKHVRVLANFVLECKKIDHKRKLNQVSLKYYQSNSQSGKGYHHSYCAVVPNRGRYIIPNIYTGLPSEQLLNDYEQMKDKFIADLTESTFAKVRQIEEQDSIRNCLTARQAEILELAEQGLNQSEMGASLGITSSAISNALLAIKKKGILIKKQIV